LDRHNNLTGTVTLSASKGLWWKIIFLNGFPKNETFDMKPPGLLVFAKRPFFVVVAQKSRHEEEQRWPMQK